MLISRYFATQNVLKISCYSKFDVLGAKLVSIWCHTTLFFLEFTQQQLLLNNLM